MGWFALVMALAVLVLIAVHRTAHRAGLARPGVVAARYAIGMGVWLALTGVLAARGFYADFSARPPRMFFALAPGLVLFNVVALRGDDARRLVAAMPRTWPIALQSMRALVELGLYGLMVQGRLPTHLTFEGRNFDVLVGLSAPVVAVGVARGWIRERGLIAWNLASIALLINIVGMAITTMPGPLHLVWPGPSNVVIAELPYVWLPAFLVPLAALGHTLSLRQIRHAAEQSDAVVE